jgi:hypothetical protein
MRDGKWVRRAEWESGVAICSRPDLNSFVCREVLNTVHWPGATSINVLADDWEIVPDDPLLLPAVDDAGARLVIANAAARDAPDWVRQAVASNVLRALHDYARKKAESQ